VDDAEAKKILRGGRFACVHPRIKYTGGYLSH
jgi:hypothetical protein